MFRKILLLSFVCNCGVVFSSNNYSSLPQRPSMSAGLNSGVLTIANVDVVTSDLVARLCGPIKDFVKEVRIGGDVERIGEYAFEGFTALQNVTLPQTLRTIENGAFQGCKALQIVQFLPSPENPSRKLEFIGSSAFRECSSLKEIYLPTSVQSIGYRAFDGCLSLSRVVLGTRSNANLISSSVRGSLNIDSGAFNNCKSLEPGDIVINEVVNLRIAEDAFDGRKKRLRKSPICVLRVTPPIEIKWYNPDAHV